MPILHHTRCDNLFFYNHRNMLTHYSESLYIFANIGTDDPYTLYVRNLAPCQNGPHKTSPFILFSAVFPQQLIQLMPYLVRCPSSIFDIMSNLDHTRCINLFSFNHCHCCPNIGIYLGIWQTRVVVYSVQTANDENVQDRNIQANVPKPLLRTSSNYNLRPRRHNLVLTTKSFSVTDTETSLLE